MQQGVQTDATCNIQQCCVRLHAALVVPNNVVVVQNNGKGEIKKHAAHAILFFAN